MKDFFCVFDVLTFWLKTLRFQSKLFYALNFRFIFIFWFFSTWYLFKKFYQKLIVWHGVTFAITHNHIVLILKTLFGHLINFDALMFCCKTLPFQHKLISMPKIKSNIFIFTRTVKHQWSCLIWCLVILLVHTFS